MRKKRKFLPLRLNMNGILVYWYEPMNWYYDKHVKWSDKSISSYDMLDFKSYIKSLTRKYLLIGRHMLQIQGHIFAISKV